jgi:hypothetical protein
MRDQIIERFRSNIARARNLVTLYRAQRAPGGGRRPVHSTDTLRAAVVFLHAAIEETFRSIYVWKVPHSTEQVLNDVPMIGSSTQRAEKFLLGRLAPYRAKTVQELITESVLEQARMLSVNNTTDVVNLLQRFGLRSQDYDVHFGPLAEMIARRHHIVHQADRNETRGVGEHQAQSLNVATVEGWIASISTFAETVLQNVPDELI